MARRNMQEEARQRNMREAYKKFKENLKENPLEGDNLALIEAIKEMENTIESQEKQITEYKGFFATLASFLPRRHTTSTLLRA